MKMLDEFIFLGEEKAKEAVIYNPIKIAESIEDIKPISDGTFPPFLENAEDELKTSTYNKAHNIYGENLPEIVEKRLKKELDSIIKNGYSVCVRRSAPPASSGAASGRPARPLIFPSPIIMAPLCSGLFLKKMFSIRRVLTSAVKISPV